MKDIINQPFIARSARGETFTDELGLLSDQSDVQHAKIIGMNRLDSQG